MNQPFAMPDRIAIDAAGCGWRVWDDDTWSMVPQNPDNSPIPEPLTWFVPEATLAETTRKLGETIVARASQMIGLHDCESEGPDAGPDPERCAMCAYAAQGEALIAEADALDGKRS